MTTCELRNFLKGYPSRWKVIVYFLSQARVKLYKIRILQVVEMKKEAYKISISSKKLRNIKKYKSHFKFKK